MEKKEIIKEALSRLEGKEKEDYFDVLHDLGCETMEDVIEYLYACYRVYGDNLTPDQIYEDCIGLIKE